mmetsp:Transcript_99887/g.287003  ORF Transcript_99887/g.287003 Transcript_99887/m.287003 type:complete len:347 (-) Transcript_99887:1028-2068(-)
MDIADESAVRFRLDDRQTAEAAVPDLREDFLDGAGVGIHADEVLVHDVTRPGTEREIVGLMQVWVAAQADVIIVDAMRERIAHPLGREDREHERDNELQRAGQFIHDDDKRNRHPTHPAEHGRGADHGVHLRVHGRHAREPRRPHENAQAAAQASAAVQGRDEQAARHAGAESDRHLQEAHQRREQQRPHETTVRRRFGLSVAKAEHLRARGMSVLARVEQSPDRCRGQGAGVRRGVACDRRDHRDPGNLSDDRHAIPESRAVAPSGADLHVPLYKARAEHAAQHPEEDEPRVFGDRGHLRGVGLEHRQLPRARGVVPQQRQGGNGCGEESADHCLLGEHGADLLV